MTYVVARTQHAVGQGGFHSAWVCTGRRAVAYVYDCGAEGRTGRQRLDDEIDRFTRPFHGPASSWAEFGALFVSHFDRDHTNGIPSLVQACTPRRVFLPYLAPAERLALLVDASATGMSEGWHTDLVRDPVAWFRTRGVDGVYVVHPDPGIGVEEPEGERPPERREEDLPDLDTRKMRRARAPDGSPQQQGERHVTDASPIPITTTTESQRATWYLILHCSRSDPKIGRFGRRVETFFRGRGATTEQVLSDSGRLSDVLANRKDLRALARIYRDVWNRSGEKNNTSMSLYSGPDRDTRGVTWAVGAPWRHMWHPHLHPLLDDWAHLVHLAWPGHAEVGRAGWLCTGDAPLGRARFRAEFLRHYAAVSGRVGTLILPHHGSRYSFDPKILDSLNPWRVVAAAGRQNRHGHPHERVVLEATARAGTFVHVDEAPRSSLTDWTLVVE